jgi:hypothetical protein
MRAKRTAGNFTYATFDGRDNYRLVGWGKQGRRIIVVP